MKVHAFDVELNGKSYRAFTRDKARKAIKQKIVLVEDDDVSILPHQWKYVGQMSTSGLSHSDHTIAIHEAIKSRGVAIVRMPPIRRDFFVFDKQLDYGDIRIYSSDRELTNFNRFWHLMEMKPDGDAYKGSPPKFVGEVNIPNASIAKTMGIDFDTLQQAGCEVHFVRESSVKETFRRHLERSVKERLKEEFAGIGIEIVDLKIHGIKFHKQNDEQDEVQEKLAEGPLVADKAVHIENKNIVNIHSLLSENNSPAKPQPGIFDRWWVKALGLVSALIGIWMFFGDYILKLNFRG